MTALRSTLFSAALLVLLGSASAHAETTKFGPRARIALGRLRAGASPATLQAQRAAVRATGELDVFVVGNVSRQALERAGARVRSETNGVFTAWIPPTA